MLPKLDLFLVWLPTHYCKIDSRGGLAPRLSSKQLVFHHTTLGLPLTLRLVAKRTRLGFGCRGSSLFTLAWLTCTILTAGAFILLTALVTCTPHTALACLTARHFRAVSRWAFLRVCTRAYKGHYNEWQQFLKHRNSLIKWFQKN